jgi:hypothetical protein
VKTYKRKTSYEKCRRKFRIGCPGVSVRSKLSMSASWSFPKPTLTYEKLHYILIYIHIYIYGNVRPLSCRASGFGFQLNSL